MTYNGEGIRVAKGDCMIIIANQLVTAIRPSENFRVKVIYIEVGFLEACTPHTSYGVTGGLTMFVNPVMHLDEREQWLCERDFDEPFTAVNALLKVIQDKGVELKESN